MKEKLFRVKDERLTDKGKEISRKVGNFFDFIVKQYPEVSRRDLGYIFHDEVTEAICKALVFEKSRKK